MRFAAAAIGTLAVLAGCYLLMWRGWRNRQHRQAGIAAPPQPPVDFTATESVEGVYVATTTGGDWLDRIAVHGLGVRSESTVEVGAEGVVFRPPGFFVPAARLVAVRTDKAIAGKVASGLLIVTWRHGDRELDTGFRPRHTADVARLSRAIDALIPKEVTQ
jgi:hypothetical protein